MTGKLDWFILRCAFCVFYGVTLCWLIADKMMEAMG